MSNVAYLQPFLTKAVVLLCSNILVPLGIGEAKQKFKLSLVYKQNKA